MVARGCPGDARGTPGDARGMPRGCPGDAPGMPRAAPGSPGAGGGRGRPRGWPGALSRKNLRWSVRVRRDLRVKKYSIYYTERHF